MKDVRGHFATLLRLILGAVFLYAGALKIGNPTGFAGDIAAYRLLPYFANYLAAAVLPWLEVLCGLLLIAGWRTRAALFMVALLNIVFMAALASVLVRGLDIDCGCFRHGAAKTSAWSAMARDFLFLVATLALIRKGGNPFGNTVKKR